MGLTRDEYEERIRSYCKARSAPLWAQNYFLRDGHSETTPNATASFIKFRGRRYACTCEHVTAFAEGKRAQEDSRHTILAFMAGKTVVNMGNFDINGLCSSFRTPGGGLENERVDIAITAMDGVWHALGSEKDVVDLDDWQEPPWQEIQIAAAMGYATEQKVRDGNIVKTPMPCAVAEVRSELRADRSAFTLQSTLEKPHDRYFSGMSGGLVVGCWDEEFAPIGIIFEGQPSTKEGISKSALFGPNDICIRGLILTPERFSQWLAQMPRA